MQHMTQRPVLVADNNYSLYRKFLKNTNHALLKICKWLVMLVIRGPGRLKTVVCCLKELYHPALQNHMEYILPPDCCQHTAAASKQRQRTNNNNRGVKG